ncbi:MAG: glycosyltransferase family 2 protein [Prochlorococcus sp.]
MAVAAVTGDHRRGKTALFLIACGWAGAAPHWLDPIRSLLPAITLAFVVGGYGLRTVLRGRISGSAMPEKQASEPWIGSDDPWPAVDVVVAARDEQAVVTRLVERLAALRYPSGKLATWIIDDGSEDSTPELLDGLQARYPALQVIHRSPDAGGGKSGALNAALAQLKGDWLLVLDADAQLQQEVLERLVPFAVQGGWSAVQLRKAVIDAEHNWLTRSQAMEMALDAVIQEGRLASGGVMELRGNGQLIRRDVLESCGGFNEDTVTDDLDLSFRLLIGGALVGILWDPPVQEEAVGSLGALWKQRQRWAEGGLQRFFDYWPALTSSQLTLSQRRDLACFFLLQYALPVVSFADLTTSLVSRTLPCYWPLSFVAFSVSGLAYWRGCRRPSEGPAVPSPNPISLLVAIAYLVHWFVVIPWVSLRMALLPKRLVWAKTSHGEQPVQV